jgi:hypothetical protein
MLVTPARCNLQKIRECPFIDFARSSSWQLDKSHSALPGAIGPDYFTISFHPDTRTIEIEPKPHALLLAQRRDGLKPHAGAAEVADDARIGIIERNVGESAQLMPVVGTRLPRRERYDLHTLR